MKRSKLSKPFFYFLLPFFILIFTLSTSSAGAIEDAPKISDLLLNVLNFLLQIFGIIAIISLVVSGIVYLTSFGDDDRIKTAKKAITFSIVGIAVALSGLIIIKTIDGFLK